MELSEFDSTFRDGIELSCGPFLHLETESHSRVGASCILRRNRALVWGFLAFEMKSCSRVKNN